MTQFGFLRVAAATPTLRVADCAYNVEHILGLMDRAEEQGVAVLVFPELSLTGYTCADLFQQAALQTGALAALEHVVRASTGRFSGLAIVGLPLALDDRLFNCAAVLHKGKVLGLVPKSFIPNYKEFYECRWFAPAASARSRQVDLDGQAVPFGTSFLFEATEKRSGVFSGADQSVTGSQPSARCGQDSRPLFCIGVEICEDLWVPIPPSSFQALQGATLLVNLSASNEVISKSAYRRQLVVNQSGRCMAAYVYAASGVFESTTDVVFGGHSMIAENGVLLAEAERFGREDSLLVADIDLERLQADRIRTNSFSDAHLYAGSQRQFTRIPFSLEARVTPLPLQRDIEAHPFVPRGHEQLYERCHEIFQTQVSGLAQRLEQIGQPAVTIGISGGLDSTLGLVVACKTMDVLGVPRGRIQAFTMPGFGTTARTRANARSLMQHLGVTANEVDIRSSCLEEMRALEHRPFGIDLDGLTVDELTSRLRQLKPDQREDLVFENVQARMRTSILMNAGFVIGTSDVSELALGWCTYNGDHMSMYNPNVSIPKTLVKFLVKWVAENEFDGEARKVLLDIVATEISPELLPAGNDDKAVQCTESVLGPYELHDFFLYHFLRFGETPQKILFLAEQAQFDHRFSAQELRRWLTVFIKRFFGNQFKRSCLPDGPKVGSISLSPRGDWRMPSDAQATLWLQWAEES
jgi:NAD+ synthase (glutamine-hydrolysing)